MDTGFPPFEPNGANDGPHYDGRNMRLREIPFRLILPNLITILAICAGLTGVRLAFEDRFELAVLMVLIAAFLDGIDGRVARLLKASTRFGAQMDSLADIVNFGMVPALVLYAYVLNDAGSLGWIAALIYAIAAALRLARFNVMDEEKGRPAWQSAYFVGVPAPAGAALVMMPIYLSFIGLDLSGGLAYAVSIYTIIVALLLTSRLAVWSGKGETSMRRDWVVPIMFAVLIYILLLISYPWIICTLTGVAYWAFLPFSANMYAKREKLEAAKQLQTIED